MILSGSKYIPFYNSVLRNINRYASRFMYLCLCVYVCKREENMNNNKKDYYFN